MDLTRVYHESPKEHYTKLFKRIRGEDGDWIYSLQENLDTLLLNKRIKTAGGEQGDSGTLTPMGWEEVPEDFGQDDEDELAPQSMFMGMQIS